MIVKIVLTYCFILVILLTSFSGEKLVNQRPVQTILRKELEPITQPPVKMDGGCSFFTFMGELLNKNKYFLLISAEKVTFIKYKGFFIYLKRTERKDMAKGYVEEYRDKNYKLILKITSIHRTNNSSIREGTAELLSKNTRLNFKIHGNVEEIDKYNYPAIK